MNKVVKNVIKEGLAFAAVGALLALAAPPLAVAFGLAETTAGAVAALHIATPLWLGIFFGAFGAINAAVQPVANWAFGDKPLEEPQKKSRIIIAVAPAQEKSCCTKHRDAVEASRAQQEAGRSL